MERSTNDPASGRTPPEHISERPAKGTVGSDKKERELELDADLQDTFPASDPVPPKHVD